MVDDTQPPQLSFEEEAPANFAEPLSFVEDGKAPLPDNIVDKRAAKADFALQDKSPGFDTLREGIASGNETQLRNDSAMAMDIQKYNEGIETVKAVSAKMGRTLIPDEINQVLKTAQGASERTDPDTLWEKLYAVHYTKAFVMDDPEKNYIFGKAYDKWTGETTEALDRGSNTQAWREIVATKLEDLQARWEDKSTMIKVGRTVQSVAGSIIQLENFFLHDAVKEAPTTTILPGRNMLEQVQYLYMLPVDKRAKIMNETVDKLFDLDPYAAFKFMKAMDEYSSSDVHLHDLLSVVDPLMFFIPFKFGGKAAITSEEMFARAGYGIGRKMNTEELLAARKGAKEIARGGVTEAGTPRQFTVRELMAMRDGLGIEQPTGMFTPFGIERMTEKLGSKENPITGYTMNGQQFKNARDTIFVNPDELNAKMATSGDNPRRLFRNSEGQLAVSENVEGRWTPTGAKIGYSDNPEVGRVALQLGPERVSRGSKYYDNYHAQGRVEDVQRIGTVTEPRPLTLQEITRASEGVPWRAIDQTEIQQMRNSVAQAIKAYNPIRTFDLQAMTESMGKVGDAASIGAFQQLTRRLQGLDPLGEGKEFAKNIPSILQGERFYAGATRTLSNGLAQQFANQAIYLNDQLLNAVLNPTRAPRLDTPALQAGIDAAKKKWANDAYFKSDGLLNIEHIPANNITNVDAIGFNFGKQTKELFDTPQQAGHWATEVYKFHDGDWVTRQVGNKFQITVPRPLDETDPTVFAKMIATRATETPKGLANMLFGYLRNSEDVLSEFNRATRHIVTHSPQELKAVLKNAAEGISDLSKPFNKKSLRELEEILMQNQKTTGPDGIPGVFFRDVAEFEESFLRRFNKLPTPEQVKGYDTYVRLNEFDGMLRVLGWHRDMSRAGIVNYRFNLMQAGEKFQTEFIPGRPGKIDYGSMHDEGIYFYDASSGTGQFVRKFALKDDEQGLRKLIDDRVKNEGYQVIQLFAPNKKPLASVSGTDDVIHYVVTSGVEHKRLAWGQGVDWRPGGHMIYQDSWFIKQPLIRTGAKGLETYFGDATIRAGGMSEKGAQELAKKYDQGRVLLKAGDDAALDTYLRANLPDSLSDFKKMFSGGGPSGGLSVDHPIVATYTGRNTFETNTLLAKEERYRGLREQATHPSNLEATLDKKFLAERGPILSRVANAGTESNPIWKFEDARLVDPFTGLNMALGNAVRSRFFTDYKQSVAAHWVSEFSDVIKGGMARKDQLERNPVYALYHAELDKAVVDRERYQAAKEVRDRALMLLGTKTDLGAAIGRVEQTVMNALYSVDKMDARRIADGKQGIFSSGANLTESVTPTMLAAIKDPAQYVRSVAFHFKLGFFNPVQLLVQAQTMHHAMAISPTNAPSAMAAYFASTRLRFTEAEDIVNYMSKKIPGWTPTEFKEAYTGMKNTGLQHVGGETAWRDDMFDPAIFTTATSRWLDKGAFFFKEGERASREVAWFVAYKEWRKANPEVVFDQRAIGTVMNRWQTMTGDMTRASNAGWQKGVFTIPTQFLTYNIRMMEQLLPGLSSRLTPMEKLRVVGTYSTLYGIPIGLSSMTGFSIPGAPATSIGNVVLATNYDDMRKYAIDHNLDIHDKWFQALHEGLYSTLLTWATGREFNAGQRLGPGANNLLVEILKGNKDVVQTLAGPAGGVLADIAKTTMPFIRNAYYATKGDDNLQYPIAMEDFSSILQSDNISSLSTGAKALIGFYSGKYIAKHNVYVGDVTTVDSLFMGLGFTPQHITDAQLTSAFLKDEKKMKDSLTKEIVEEMQNGYRKAAAGDDDGSSVHFRRARTLEAAGNFTVGDHNKAFHLSLTGWESQVDRVNRRMLTTNPERAKRMLDKQEQK